MTDEGKIEHKWHPLENLPSDYMEMASPDLSNLASVWCDQRNRLEKTDAMKSFLERMRREWAIETGIIENLYTIDRGITEVLIEKGIEASLIPHNATDRPAENVVDIIKAQEEALEGIFAFVKQQRKLSKSYIKQLHQVITRHQTSVAAKDTLGRIVDVSLLRGDWKKIPNNPRHPGRGLHEYCPPEQVESEMERLLSLHEEHKSVPPEIEAAWLHHGFTQIHPFQDGNGRIARALASLVFLRYGYFPLVIHRDIRAEYIDALEMADTGQLQPLVELFAKVQKKAFINALSVSETVLKQQETLSDVMTAAVERLHAKRLAKYHNVFQVAARLEEVALGYLSNVSAQLTKELRAVSPEFAAWTDRNQKENDFWYKFQITQVARELEYFADTRTYRAWVRLRISEERQTSIVISFHSLGTQFVGVLAASAFLEHRQRDEDGQAVTEGLVRLPQEVFDFSYFENMDDIVVRFEKWLAASVLVGLDQWGRDL